MNLARAALSYAKFGRSVFPLVEGGKRPATGHGVKDATTDRAKICAWWTERPSSNIGLAVLPHELVVDVDVRSGGDQTLFDWLEGSRASDEPGLPNTPTQKTPTTGSHFFFKRPAGFELVAHPGAGIDVLGVGKYVVAAPSRIEGRADPYVWTTRLSKTPLAELPNWLARLVLRVPPPPPKPPPQYTRAGADVITRAERWLEKADPAIQGSGGSNTCFRVVTRLVRGFVLDEETALHLLESIYNPKCDPAWSRKELRHKVRQAIKSGKCEWGVLRDRQREERRSA